MAPVISESYAYDLPNECIAQRPVTPPDTARLLIVDRARHQVFDSVFRSLPEVLKGRGTLVVNDSKVIPARLSVRVNGEEAELFLLKERDSHVWECTGRPLKKLRVASEFVVEGSSSSESCVRGRVVEDAHPRVITVHFSRDGGDESIREFLFRSGSMPIPPYIRGGVSDDQDRMRYQSVFAVNEGSIAASTASLHFTPELIASLIEEGIELRSITLHMGLQSISPAPSPDGKLAPEEFSVREELLCFLLDRKAQGHPVIAVGTSVARALETAMRGTHKGATDLFISPGFSWRIVDGLITNFHAPITTHLHLVEALLGRSLLHKAYSHALSLSYRFLSYGDSMIISPR
jgi:S-adenosylmethionine:tRNA ribosyltransferase-isomerase